MIHICVGCGEIDRRSPPLVVMPRMILNYRSEIVCEPCKVLLEECLLKRWSQWLLEKSTSWKPIAAAVDSMKNHERTRTQGS